MRSADRRQGAVGGVAREIKSPELIGVLKLVFQKIHDAQQARTIYLRQALRALFDPDKLLNELSLFFCQAGCGKEELLVENRLPVAERYPG
jgi:hypothetical protein